MDFSGNEHLNDMNLSSITIFDTVMTDKVFVQNYQFKLLQNKGESFYSINLTLLSQRIVDEKPEGFDVQYKPRCQFAFGSATRSFSGFG